MLAVETHFIIFDALMFICLGCSCIGLIHLPLRRAVRCGGSTQGFLGLFTSNVDRIVARLQWAKSSPAEREKLVMWSVDSWPSRGMDLVTAERLVRFS